MSSPTIIFLDVPPKTFVGIDFASFNAAPNFHGISNITPGLHFVYTGSDASLSIRQGRWLRLTAQIVHVLRWNTNLEHLDLLEPDAPQAQQARTRLPEFQARGLVDYTALLDASANLQKQQEKGKGAAAEEEEDDDTQKTVQIVWQQLVSHITPRLVGRVTADIPGVLSSVSSAPQDTDHIPGLTHEEAMSELASAGMLHFISIDLKQTWPAEAVGQDRTRMARDRSWYLRKLIEDVSDGSEMSQQQAASQLLGELQFCFIGVLCLANYSCLEQWKRILSIVFTCREALVEVEGFFVETVKVLRAQLGRVEDVEGGLFEMSDEFESRWLRQSLKTFRGHVDEVHESTQSKDAKLQDELKLLETWLQNKYGWADDKSVLRKGMIQLEDGEMVEMDMNDADEEEETGEYAPVVVDM